MDDASPTLLMTRPDAQSRAFLAECEADLQRRLPVVIAPVMRIVDMGDVPDLEPFETVIATSSHAVRRLGQDGQLRGRRVVTVGDMTAAVAREFGADAEALGGDVSAFLAASDALRPPCFYARGRHVRVDLVRELASRGVACSEAMVYDQVAQPLPRAGEALLAGTLPVVAPLFSARTAELLCRSTDIQAPLTVIAMSDGVAAAWTGSGEVRIVKEPTSAAMCAAVRECF